MKVGVSRDPKRRRSQLQAALADRLELFASIKPAHRTAFEVEQAVKGLLARWRVSGEWYKCSPDIASLAIEAADLNCARRRSFFLLLTEERAANDERDRARNALRATRRDDPEVQATAQLDFDSGKLRAGELTARLFREFPEWALTADPYMGWRFRRARDAKRARLCSAAVPRGAA